MLNHVFGEAVCSRVLVGLILLGRCQNSHDGQLGMLVVEAYTGQQWWRGGVEADARISVG